MSRSIHKTVARVARDNTKADLADPQNPDVAELARKIGYKRTERADRIMKKSKVDRPIKDSK